LRTPLDPDITFKDDPLRMLRAVRFAAKYNWKLSKNLINSLVNNSDQLRNISQERIQDEFNKILMTDRPGLALKILSITGLMKHTIPEIELLRGVTQNVHHKHDVFDHTLEVLQNTPKDLKARLAALFHDIGKPKTRTEDETGIHFYDHEDVGAQMVPDIMERLKYSNEMISSITNIVKNHMRFKAGGKSGEKLGDKSLRRFVAAIGDDINSALGMMHADNMAHAPASRQPNQIPNIKNRIDVLLQTTTSKPTLPINGHDIMQHLNIKPGPIMKKLLSAVEDAWFDDPSLTKNAALDIVKRTHDSLQDEPSKQAIDILNKKMINPKTKNKILVKTALGYEDDHPAKKLAMKLIDKTK
jgi:putative nucleotidyltransferase with HDIG domain